MKNATSELTTYKEIEGYFRLQYGQKIFMSKEFEGDIRKHWIEFSDQEWEENAPSEMKEDDIVDSGYGFMMKDTERNRRLVQKYKYDAIEMIN